MMCCRMLSSCSVLVCGEKEKESEPNESARAQARARERRASERASERERERERERRFGHLVNVCTLRDHRASWL